MDGDEYRDYDWYRGASLAYVIFPALISYVPIGCLMHLSGVLYAFEREREGRVAGGKTRRGGERRRASECRCVCCICVA